MPITNPFKKYAGYRARKKNSYTGNYNVLYDGDTQQLDTSDGKWVTVCEEHGTVLNHTTLAKAKKFLEEAEWCEKCMAIKESRK